MCLYRRSMGRPCCSSRVGAAADRVPPRTPCSRDYRPGATGCPGAAKSRVSEPAKVPMKQKWPAPVAAAAAPVADGGKARPAKCAGLPRSSAYILDQGGRHCWRATLEPVAAAARFPPGQAGSLPVPLAVASLRAATAQHSLKDQRKEWREQAPR